jgi:hypothetical protein
MAAAPRRDRRKPNDPAAWGYAARSPTTGKIWRTTPPSRADTSAATPSFRRANCPGEFVLSDVEPFSFRPDKTLPGTLHHSGNRPAPPSDHTPLARRSAFQRGWKREPAREFGRARGVETPAVKKILPCPGRGEGSCLPMEPRNFAVPLPLLRREAGDSHES